MVRQIIKLIIAITLIGCGNVVHGQYPPHTSYQILSTAVAAGATYTSSPVNNIGQTGHHLYLLVTSIGAGTCRVSPITGWIALQGSYDNITYFNVAVEAVGNYYSGISGIAGLTPPFNLELWADASVPYFKVIARYNATAGAADCVGAVYYAGVRNTNGSTRTRHVASKYGEMVDTTAESISSTALAGVGARAKIVGVTLSLKTGSTGETITVGSTNDAGVTYLNFTRFLLSANIPTITLPITTINPIFIGAPGYELRLLCGDCTAGGVDYVFYYRVEE